MMKKFGKFLLFIAAAGAAAATVFYFFRKKDAAAAASDDDDDYDDFSDDLDDDADASRSYVPLNKESDGSAEASGASGNGDGFTPLSENASPAADPASGETVEEFFDEDDNGDEEPPVSGN